MGETYRLSIYKLTGTGYEHGWWTNCRCRYRVFKGARNTKKSYNFIGLEIIDKLVSDPNRNVIIIRQVAQTHRNSTFNTLVSLIHQPDPEQPEVCLDPLFQINYSTMTITYRPTGQQVIFLGMLDPSKIASIKPPRGTFTDVYIEEAFELDDPDGWRIVDGSIRGDLPEGTFHQITFLMNAWNKDHWIYSHFFEGRMEDDPAVLETVGWQDWCDPDLFIDYGRGLYLHTSSYLINEFRAPEYDLAMQEMRERAPEHYKVEALGCWGNASEATYPEFSDNLVRSLSELTNKGYQALAVGIDTGLSDGQGKVLKTGETRNKSATTMVLVGLTKDSEQLVALDEYYWSNGTAGMGREKTEPQVMSEIVETLQRWRDKYLNLGTFVFPVYVDSADIGFRQGLDLEARRHGFTGARFAPSTKIKIQTRVDFSRLLMAYGDILISTQCPNLVREIKNSRTGGLGVPREDFDDHATNAWEYGWAPLYQRLRLWKTFKPRG